MLSFGCIVTYKIPGAMIAVVCACLELNRLESRQEEGMVFNEKGVQAGYPVSRTSLTEIRRSARNIDRSRQSLR